MEIFGPSEAMSWNQSICSRVVTLASRSAKPESAEAKTIPAIFGPSSPVSFAYFDPDTSCWKTSQATFLSDLEQYSETWPDSGTMRNGCVYERRISAPHTCESGSLLWPTTRSTSGGGNTSAYPGAPYRPALAQLASRWPTARSEDSESCGNPDASDSLTGATRLWRTPDAPGSGGPRNRQDSVEAGHQFTIAEQAEHWGTPSAHERTHDPRQVDHGVQLANQVDTWLTPHGMYGTDHTGKTGRGGEFAKQANHWQAPEMFPTPQSRDWKSGDASEATATKNARPLNEISERWTTPTKRANEDCPSERERKTPSLESQALLQDLPIQDGPKSSPSAPTSRQRLNPRFVEWLMGFPIGWTER